MVGSVLLVAITVVMAAALGFTVFALTKPVDPVHADITMLVKPGGNGWGDGDESIVMKHLGGETIDVSQAEVRYTIGGTTTTLSGASLGSAFSDGEFSIGETWTHAFTIPAGTTVDVDLIVDTVGGATQLLATVETSTECGTDTAQPFVSVWEFLHPTLLTPIDVNSDTTGSIYVSALATDFCSGVNTAVTPFYWYKYGNDAALPNPTVAAATTSTPGKWQFTIPQPTAGWSAYAGLTLTYGLTGLTDLATPANVGPSTTRSETIEDTNLYTPPATPPTIVSGNLPDSTDVLADDGATAEFTMASQTGSQTSGPPLDGDVISGSTDWLTKDNVKENEVPTPAYATIAVNNPGSLRVDIENPGLSGTISQVVIGAKVSIVASGTIDDSFRVKACDGASTTCTTSVSGGSSATDVDITSTRTTDWSGGTWEWTDIDALQIDVEPVKSGGRDGTWRVQYAWIVVTYTPVTYTADATFTFPAITAPGSHTLKIDYISTGSGFKAIVSDGTTTLTAVNLDQTSAPIVNIALAGLNVGTGALTLQIVNIDAPASQTAAGVLSIDYIRVQTS